MEGYSDRLTETVRRIMDYKLLFRLAPLIATTGEIAREMGSSRAEVERVAQELAQQGQIHYGKTINGRYCRINSQDKRKSIMKKFQDAIKAHLDKMAAEDDVFAAKYAAKCGSEADSIQKCCSYIINEVQKKYKVGNSAVLTDDEVFGMATHYYDENIAAPKGVANCKVVMSQAELTPEDEEAIRKEARAAAEQKIRDEEAARIRREQEEAERKKIAAEEAAERRRAAAEKKKQEEAERKRKEWEEADLLFSFDED